MVKSGNPVLKKKKLVFVKYSHDTVVNHRAPRAFINLFKKWRKFMNNYGK